MLLVYVSMKYKIYCGYGGNVRLKNEGEDIMKIAVPTVGDQVDQHFGHCENIRYLPSKITPLKL